jgi:hypothetical protein
MQVCGASVPNQCGVGVCTPKTCASLGFDCGDAPDGCSGTLHCGTCAAPLKCGVGGMQNHCACQPKTCDQLAAKCGAIGDGCGGMLDCGSCPANQVCGAKQPNHCDRPVDAGP